MYEEYLEDASYLFNVAGDKEGREAKKYYRAAVFYAFSALEAFVNYIGDTLEQGGTEPYEVAFMTDKKFGIDKDRFKILDKSEFHRIEDKLRYLIHKFCRNSDVINSPCWSGFKDFKRLRDSIVHPKNSEDGRTCEEYKRDVKVGINSVIEIIDEICKGFFKRQLRVKILELKV
jgi:hypothetical protein